MSPFARKSMPPRIVTALGVVGIVVSNFLADQPTLQAALQIAGGLTALAGVIWFVMVMRSARRG